MSGTVSEHQLAEYLHMLKNRSRRSYEALARRTGVSGSSLHRYCTGSKIPTEYAVVQRFAHTCGATDSDLRELYRLWVLADAGRREQARGAEDVEDDHAVAPPERDGDRPPRPRGRLLALALAVLVVVGTGVTWWIVDDSGSVRTVGGPLLLSEACPPVISMGQHDECVREVQELLKRHGAQVDADSDYGPQTLRRVIAFQVLADLHPRGVVDEPTKRALYDQRVDMRTWSPQQVEDRIRAVFPEEPNRAVAIAKCQSFLDPLHVLPNTNGTRNWGIFQLSDTLLRELGGTPVKAFDPEWNIQTARRAWSRYRDFRDWPHCDQAFQTGRP